MAVDIFLQIDGVKGESTDSSHKDWIEVLSYKHSIGQPAAVTLQAADTTAPGRKHQDFTITKYVDLASPKLYEACSSGKHINKVALEMTRATGGAPVKYMSVEMDDVVVSRVAAESSALTTGAIKAIPTESVSFSYGTIKWTYTQIKADGSAGGNVVGGWDVTTNKSV